MKYSLQMNIIIIQMKCIDNPSGMHCYTRDMMQYKINLLIIHVQCNDNTIETRCYTSEMQYNTSAIQ